MSTKAPDGPSPRPPGNDADGDDSHNARDGASRGATAPSAKASVAGQHWSRLALERRLAFAWFAAFVVGTVAIISLPATGPRRMAVPVLALLGYFLYGVNLRKKNIGRFADSLYFMGFLWTLVALIDVLFQGKLTAENVFKAFGYALVTTASGMFLRLLVIQFQETVPDRLIEAQDQIDLHVARFTAQMNRATHVVADFHDSARARLTERLATLTKLLQDIENEILRTHTTAAQKSLDSLGVAVQHISSELQTLSIPKRRLEAEADNLSRSIQASSQAFIAATGRLQESLYSTAVAIETQGQILADRIRQIDIPPDLFKHTMDDLTAHVKETLDALTADVTSARQNFSVARQQLQDTLSADSVKRDIDASLRAIATTLEEGQKEYQVITANAHAVSGTLESIVQQLQTVALSLDACRRTFGALESTAVAAAETNNLRLQDKVFAAEGAMEDARQAGADLRATVDEVLQFAKKHLP